MKRGVTSPSHWFYVPTIRARDMACNAGDGRVCIEKLQRRVDCMLCWWKHRSNSLFVQQDSLRLLEAMHESGEMDLSTEEGRLAELRAYWLLVFVCAHDPWLWDVRAHWEHALLKWRVAHYYCREHHFACCLLNNTRHAPCGLAFSVLTVGIPRLCPIAGIEKVEDVDPIVLNNYGRRFPGAALPSTWVRVPFSSMPPSAMAKPEWDVNDGEVIITFRDYVPWVWHQMVQAADDMERRIHVSRYDDVLDMDRLTADQDMLGFIGPLLGQCQKMRDEERTAMRLAQETRVQATLPPIGQVEDLLKAVKSRMPLCMLQHFWLAFERGKHPKNASRLSLAKFLLEAGYDVQQVRLAPSISLDQRTNPRKQVDGIMFGLFSLDAEFMQRYGANGWNEGTYHKKFGVQVVHLHSKVVVNKTIGAYGCAKLVEAGRAGDTCGCPFFKSGPGARKDLAMMLDWAAIPPIDIEDIAGREVRDPQVLFAS